MDGFLDNVKNILSHLGMPRSFHFSYILEILILTVIIYELLVWVKNTRAWTLLKGIIVILVFVAVCYILNLTTITWIISKTAGVLFIMLVILFQPELRRALEQLGRRNFFASFMGVSGGRLGEEDGRSQEKINDEIVKAVFEMSKARTGALIVIENQVELSEYERTGIPVDAFISNQLLINIFEKNTPLHDGAVIIKNNRIVAATCYLPLTDRTDVNKELGTRHRAGLGISEATDSMTIIVSEETGSVSIAHGGVLYMNLDENGIRTQLEKIQDKPEDRPVKSRKLKKGGRKA